MSDFLECIKIQNYKIFESLNDGQGITFGIPQANNPGSGLTILIGENNSGKSTIINAFGKLKPDSRFYDVESTGTGEVYIEIQSERGKCRINKSQNNSRVNFVSESFSYNDIEIVKETRQWTSNFTDDNFGHDAYVGNQDNSRTAIDSNLARRLATILARDPKKKQKMDGYFKQIIPEFRDWSISSHSPGSGDRIGYKVGNKYIEIDTSLGSGMLSLFRIVLALADSYNIIIIDEPEAFLHPQAQIRLNALLNELSTSKQIIFSTHSPYMMQKSVGIAAKIYRFSNINDSCTVEDLKDKINPSLVSWNYLSWKVFGVLSMELHIELYDKLFCKMGAKSVDDFNNKIHKRTTEKKQNRSSNPNAKDYGKPSWGTEETLPVWIRNFIHHPELSLQGSRAKDLGHYRKKPTESDIEKSIIYMSRELTT